MNKLIFALIILQFGKNILNATMILQNTGITTDFHSVKFINKNTDWICGTEVIAKTTNAVVKWINQIHSVVKNLTFGIINQKYKHLL